MGREELSQGSSSFCPLYPLICPLLRLVYYVERDIITLSVFTRNISREEKETLNET